MMSRAKKFLEDLEKLAPSKETISLLGGQVRQGSPAINMRDGYRIAYSQGKYLISPVGKGNFKKVVTDDEGVEKFLRRFQ
jgi:hypothetical protein